MKKVATSAFASQSSSPSGSSSSAKRLKKSPCPTSATLLSGRCLTYSITSRTRSLHTFSDSMNPYSMKYAAQSAAPWSSVRAISASSSMCHQLLSSFEKSSSGKAEASVEGSEPISQLSVSCSRSEACTSMRTGIPRKAMVAVCKALVSGDTSTTSGTYPVPAIPHSLRRLLSSSTCASPCAVSGASNSIGSFAECCSSSAAALYTDCACRMRCTAFLPPTGE
mmetsp:Transcript_23137/g.75440  ORF Transcript_23137/g.75440 Transcript_23137/m.75440 type:complete len:223 (+) Transcript_23137:114-782(+)